VIKRLRFATRKPDVPAGTFGAEWPLAVAAGAGAPPGCRPLRIAVCLTLPGLCDASPRCDGISLEWFADAGHLQRFGEWLASPAGRRVMARAGQVIDLGASPVVAADEAVVRGADWLARRWHDGGARLKHMALATRAGGLTPAEFSRAWRQHAGQLRQPGAAQPTVIPDSARGRAYIQNHPLPLPDGEWAYDAVNEVYFDDAAGLRARIGWFRDNLPGQAADGLVSQSWFLAVREIVLAADLPLPASGAAPAPRANCQEADRA
jgi:hypothetical protein